jgi:hypothetical protein
MLTYRNGTGNSTTSREITGLQVAREPRSTMARVKLAAAIQRGETRLTKLTYGQIASICGVSTQQVYLYRIRQAYAEECRRRQLARAAVQLAAE